VELLGLGVYLAAVVVLPLLAGARIDSALGSAPVGLVVGLGLGILAGFAGVYLRFRRYL
jgi:F0F1-type ATP synthase assembly protein I